MYNRLPLHRRNVSLTLLKKGLETRFTIMANRQFIVRNVKLYLDKTLKTLNYN